MTKKAIYRYVVPCATEGERYDVWAHDPPTTCPRSIAHTVDTSNVEVLESKTEGEFQLQTVRVAEDFGEDTNGNFRSESFLFEMQPGHNSHVVQFPYPVSVLVVKIMARAEHKGDVINVFACPNRPVGATTAAASPGDTVIQVSPTVHKAMNRGYLPIIDGVKAPEVRSVLINRIELAAPLSMRIEEGRPVLFEVCIIKNLHLQSVVDQLYTIGDSKIGATNLSPGQSFRVDYNNSGSANKEFHFSLEYLY